MRSKRILVSGALLAVMTGLIVVGLSSGTLSAPWGGSSAEARTAVLSAGTFTPIGGEGTDAPAGRPAAPLLTGAPNTISFQGRLTDPGTGNAIANGDYDITFRVFDAPIAGTLLYEDSYTLAVASGLITVALSVDASIFDDLERHLEVQVGTDPPMTPRLQFLSVPYAFHAATAQNANVADDVSNLCVGCIGDNQVAFNYAGSTSKGGPASDLACVNCIATGEIADGQVSSADIANNTIATADVALDSITTGLIAPGTITTDDIGTGAVNSGDISDGTITSTDISDGAITSTDIANATVASVDIADDTITSTDITNSTVASIDIADATITNADILDGTITSGDILDGAISGADLTAAELLLTGAGLRLGSTTPFTYQNADAGIGLSANGTDGNQFIYFFEGASPTGESLQWNNTFNRFEFSDDLHAALDLTAAGTVTGATVNSTGNLTAAGNLDVSGGVFFGSNESWIDGGLTSISSNGNYVMVDNAGLCVDDGIDNAANDECDESVGLFPGSIHADSAITANAFDVAERFAFAGEAPAPGELVVLDDGATVRRSASTPYDSSVLGIVSSDPGVILGWNSGGDVPVTLAGRVPLKATLENGPIAVGDYLTSSSTPGHAMKATEPGPTVGIALEAFDGSNEQGQVLTFVSLGDGITSEVVRDLQQRVDELESGSGLDGKSAASSGAARAEGDLALVLISSMVGAIVSAIIIGSFTAARTLKRMGD